MTKSQNPIRGTLLIPTLALIGGNFGCKDRTPDGSSDVKTNNEHKITSDEARALADADWKNYLTTLFVKEHGSILDSLYRRHPEAMDVSVKATVDMPEIQYVYSANINSASVYFRTYVVNLNSGTIRFVKESVSSPG